jgi:hypothetical protein
VQVWSTEAVADGEVKVKEDVSCRWTGGVKDGREYSSVLTVVQN